MASQKQCCPAVAARMVNKLTMPDGSQVGISYMEEVLKEVADLKMVDDETIKKELLKRVIIYNYVVPCAEADYSKALLKEYKQQYGNPNREMK